MKIISGACKNHVKRLILFFEIKPRPNLLGRKALNGKSSIIYLNFQISATKRKNADEFAYQNDFKKLN